jgi:hypothetical protein
VSSQDGLKNALHHARADAELPADLEDTVAVGLQFENSAGLNPTSAELGPILPSRASTQR